MQKKFLDDRGDSPFQQLRSVSFQRHQGVLFMSSLQQVATLAPTERRICSRDVPRILIYIAFGQNNGGMVLNVSENGLAISTAVGLNDQCISDLSLAN